MSAEQDRAEGLLDPPPGVTRESLFEPPDIKPRASAPSDADIAAERLAREENRHQLAYADRMRLWRDGICECLGLAVAYAQRAAVAAEVEDQRAFEHDIRNFIFAAREASIIFKNFRPKTEAELLCASKARGER